MGLGCEIVNWNYFTFPTDVFQLYFRKMLHFHSFSMDIVTNHTMFHPSQAGYSPTDGRAVGASPEKPLQPLVSEGRAFGGPPGVRPLRHRNGSLDFILYP